MLTLYLEGLFFPVSVGDCGAGKRGHLQLSPRRPLYTIFSVSCCPRHYPVND